MRRTRLAAALLVPLLLAGCASGDDSAAEAPVAEDADASGGAPDMAVEEMAEQEATDESVARDGIGSAAIDVAAVTPVTVDRQLARTARLVVEVDDVEQAAARVIATATRVGGFVADSQVRAGDDPDGRDAFGVLTLRVPATALDATVADLASIAARVLDQSIGTEDLTDQLVDSQAQLRNLRTLEAELLELLGDVRGGDPNASELLVVFDQVNQVRGEIERLEARRAGFQDRVALATVTVELQPVPADAALAGVAEPGVLAEAWSATRAAFGVIGELAVWTLVTVVPVLAVVVGLPLLLVAAWFRRRRPTPTDVPPPPAPAPSDERQPESVG